MGKIKGPPPHFMQVSCTEDGDVVVEMGIKMLPAEAMNLAKGLMKAAQAGVRKKPIIVPGAAFQKPS